MNTTPSQMLTYVIPTYNRPQFLHRLLSYYAKVGCSAPILIADSSEPVTKASNEATVAEFQNTLNVELHYFELGVIPKCRQILERVATPFAVFSADDDFLVPSAADKCSLFLSQNTDYGTCGGTALFGQAGLGTTIPARTYRSLTSSSAVQRLKNVSLGQYYCLFYAVHCTNRLRERFRITEEFTNYESSRILPEVLLLQLMAMDGKVRLLNDITYIRQGHGDNDSCRLPNVQDPDVFRADFNRYSQPLVKRLQAEQVPENVAIRLVGRTLVDLVPECAALLHDRPSLFVQSIRKTTKRFRKIASFGPMGAGRKFAMDVATASRQDDAIHEALEQLTKKNGRSGLVENAHRSPKTVLRGHKSA